MRSICQDVIKNYFDSWGLLLTFSYIFVRPAGRTYLGVKVLYGPGGGETVSRTARVSVVRRNLKEDAGKALA